MRRIVPIAVAAIVVISLVGVAGIALADDADNDVEDEVQPGERMTGVIHVVDAEIEGEIAERGFGISVAQAASDNATAEIVSERLENISDRVHALEERKAALEEAREAGEISEGQYRAEVARLAVEKNTSERLAFQAESTAGELPREILEAHGINVDNIIELRERAHALGGPDVREIAQGIAGPNVAESLPDSAGDRAPDDAGPPSEVGSIDDIDAADDSDDVTENFNESVNGSIES